MATIAIILSHDAGLYLGSEDGSKLSSSAQKTLLAAFTDSAGRGLWELAGRHPTAVFEPAEGFWRDFAKAFLTLILATGTARLEARFLQYWLALAPAMPGRQWLSTESLTMLWQALQTYYEQTHATLPAVRQQLQSWDPTWNNLGRVCLSLAELKSNPQRPFALLATYTTRFTEAARPVHQPLAKALQDNATAGHHTVLQEIMAILAKAAEESRLLAELVASRQIFQPQALTAVQARDFLLDLSAFESAGLMVRVPDWWQRMAPPRVQVAVTVGSTEPQGSGLSGLDFRVGLSLGGEALSPAEWESLKNNAASLVFLRGQWVDVDPGKIAAALAAWRQTEHMVAQSGISFGQALRYLIGGPRALGGERMDASQADTLGGEWSHVQAGAWLKDAVAGLADPARLAPPILGPAFKATLRPYQQEGLAWLWRLHALGLGGCLADDMGLGKTIQVIAFISALQQSGSKGRHLIVAPATLIGNWCQEAAKFAPELRVLPYHPAFTRLGAPTQRPNFLSEYDVIVTTYGLLQRCPWLSAESWRTVILDEAQAIKNPETQQSQSVRALKAEQRLALSGTPIENKALDLWSIFDFINPGLLGTAREFNSFMAEGPSSFSQLRELVAPYLLRRLKTDAGILAELPPKLEAEVSCFLRPAQAALYQRVVNDLRTELKGVSDKGRQGAIFTALLRLRQICGHPALATGQGDYSVAASGKFLCLVDLVSKIAANGERLLVFTQFRELMPPLDRELRRLFGRPGLQLHGETPVRERHELVQKFQAANGPPYFLLSLRAAGTGLTLTAASQVIHFDRWWNPAVEDQATDRAYRIGQLQQLQVAKLFCAGTIEAKIGQLISTKRELAAAILATDASAGGSLAQLSNDELFALLALDPAAAQWAD